MTPEGCSNGYDSNCQISLPSDHAAACKSADSGSIL